MQHNRELLVFPILALIAFYYLWVLMLLNGTVDAMGKAVQQQRFADGTPLRTVYTGSFPVDHALCTLVAFTYYPTNGDDQETRLLYIDILSTLQTGHLWCLIEGLRSGRTSTLFALPAVWGLLWNGLRAAVILPIYAFFQLRNRPQQQSILQSQAKALIPALVIASYIPSILAILPPLFTRASYEHQTIIGYFQLTPLALAALHYVLSRLLKSSNSTKPASEVPWIRGTLAFAAVASSMAHIYALFSATLSSNIHMSIYFGISNAQVSSANIDKIALGAAYFLQWDCAIINISTALWGAFLIRESAEINVAALSIVLLTINGLLGPGAMMSSVFYWREGRIRSDEAGTQRKNM